MSEKKLIAVIGATGAQGGGLVRAVLDDPASPFEVRAITRDANSVRARHLEESGAHVVQADLADVDGLVKAFADAHGVFVVTNFWETMSGSVELEQAQNAARAAKDARVEHVIWSTLVDTRPVLSDLDVPLLESGYTVPHFDAKADANRFFTELGVPTTFLSTTFYWEMFAHGFGPQRDSNGTLVLTLPVGDRRLAGIAVEDIGRTAYGIFRAGVGAVGATVDIAGGCLTGPEYAAAFADLLGEQVRFESIGFDEFRALGLPAGEELGNMFQYYYEAEEEFCGARDLDAIRRYNPRLQGFREWLEAKKQLFGELRRR